MNRRLAYALGWLTCFSSSMLQAQSNRIDQIGEDAPELAAFGSHAVGVQTVQFVTPNSVDVVNTTRGGETAYYDRQLFLEIWYPAALADDLSPGTVYETLTRDPRIVANLNGRAVRDAAPDANGPYPLLVLSHGYPGNRYLLSHIGENLASKGYVVVSIDHTESTYRDQAPITSTFFHRPLDQRLTIATIATTASQSGNFLNGLVDVERTGIVGFSMGGYGLINNLGAGFNPAAVSSFMAPPNELLQAHASDNPAYREQLDSRIVTGIAIAPWGKQLNFWEPDDLLGIERPMLVVAGDQDEVAGYEDGPRAIWANALNSDRYMLTFKNGSHSVAAPIPAPEELQGNEAAGHYTDANWDGVAMNNILDHFVTAWFDHHLKGKDTLGYFDVVADADQAPADNYWPGFAPGTAAGLVLEHLSAGETLD